MIIPDLLKIDTVYSGYSRISSIIHTSLLLSPLGERSGGVSIVTSSTKGRTVTSTSAVPKQLKLLQGQMPIWSWQAATSPSARFMPFTAGSRRLGIVSNRFSRLASRGTALHTNHMRSILQDSSITGALITSKRWIRSLSAYKSPGSSIFRVLCFKDSGVKGLL